MLHDPHRDITLLAFRDFAASKDPRETFTYTSRCNCACGQFARHIGLHDEWMSADLITTSPWGHLNDMARTAGGGDGWLTPSATPWGDLVKRLDEALA